MRFAGLGFAKGRFTGRFAESRSIPQTPNLTPQTCAKRYGVRIDDQIAVGMVLEIPQSKCRLSNAIGSGDENDEWLCHDRIVRLPTQNVT